MKNFLSLFSIFFLSLGIFFSISIFGLKIYFQDKGNDKIIVLGPENSNIISIPKESGGLQISNLDIDILNNKKALKKEEKVRPVQSMPELLPMEITELQNSDLSKENNHKHKKTSKNKISNINNQNITGKKIEKNFVPSSQKINFYRVQFGSFRDLQKATLVRDKMMKEYSELLSKNKLEIYSYTNNNKLLFHRVWTSPLSKFNGLALCDKFKKKQILCILQVNN